MNYDEGLVSQETCAPYNLKYHTIMYPSIETQWVKFTLQSSEPKCWGYATGTFGNLRARNRVYYVGSFKNSPSSTTFWHSLGPPEAAQNLKILSVISSMQKTLAYEGYKFKQSNGGEMPIQGLRKKELRVGNSTQCIVPKSNYNNILGWVPGYHKQGWKSFQRLIFQLVEDLLKHL